MLTFKSNLYSSGMLDNNKGVKHSMSMKGLSNQLCNNRIASKFNPDTLYDIKSLQSKSHGSISILKKDINNNIHSKLSSIYLNA